MEDAASLPARFHSTSVEGSGFRIWRPTSNPGTRLLTQTHTRVLREQFLFIVERDEARGPEGQGTANPNLPPQEPGASLENKGLSLSPRKPSPQRAPEWGAGAVTW